MPLRSGYPRRRISCHHTTAIAQLGGATLDNEENYLIKKLLNNLGVISVDVQQNDFLVRQVRPG